MKKLLAMLLALTMICSVVAVSAMAINEEDYINQDIFQVKELTKTLSPGVDYYFDCDWQGGAITDDFFEFYSVSVSVSSAFSKDDRKDDDYISSSSAKKIAEKAEFVKLNAEDKYYFHFRASSSYSYSHDDATIKITVLARDKSRAKDRDDSRSWYEFELDIGYADKETPYEVSDSQYDVEQDTPIVEFDEDLDYCRLDFEDGSYYNVKFSKKRKFNLGHSTDANQAIVLAYPNATLKFLSFYASPSFAYDSVLKVKAPNCNYLYEISDNNNIKLLADSGNGDYIGYTTSRLGKYVASNVALDTSKISVNAGSYVNSNATSSIAPTTKPSSAASSTAAVPANPAITNPPTGAAQ